MQPWSSVQQLFATQLPHAEPSDGHIDAIPQMPLVQTPVQHSKLLLHAPPSGVHCGAPHIPLLQMPAQHSKSLVHDPPSGVHIPHCCELQTELTSLTQMPSHAVLQQKEST